MTSHFTLWVSESHNSDWEETFFTLSLSDLFCDTVSLVMQQEREAA